MQMTSLRWACGTIALGALVSGPARADFPGGGPAATDCFVQFKGSITSGNVTCHDGDACDAGGTKADGSCTFALQVCTGQAGGSCPATPLDGQPTVTPAGDAATALTNAFAQIDLTAGGCATANVVVPLKISLAGIKPAKVKLTIVARAAGKADKDKLKLSCLPSTAVPSFAADVSPILGSTDQTGLAVPGSRCAVPSCHTGPGASESLNLSPATAYAALVNKRSTEAPKLLIVKPKSIRASYLAHKILGVGLAPVTGGVIMPNGCPGAPQPTGCLTPGELYTLLAWIKGGAPQ